MSTFQQGTAHLPQDIVVTHTHMYKCPQPTRRDAITKNKHIKNNKKKKYTKTNKN